MIGVGGQTPECVSAFNLQRGFAAALHNTDRARHCASKQCALVGFGHVSAL